MNVQTTKIVGLCFMVLAIVLVVIGVVQEIGIIDWLDDPFMGAIGPAIIGMMLGLMAKQKEDSAGA